MAFRVDVLRRFGAFPPELDAGTATQSGGDSYMFSRVHRGRPADRLRPGPDGLAQPPRRRPRAAAGDARLRRRPQLDDRQVAWPSTASCRACASRPGRCPTSTGRCAASSAGARSGLDVLAAAEMARGSLEAPFAWRRARRRAPARPAPDPRAGRPAPAPPAGPGGAPPRATRPSRWWCRPSASARRCSTAASRRSTRRRSSRDEYEIILVPNGPGSERLRDHPGADRIVRSDVAGAAARAQRRRPRRPR